MSEDPLKILEGKISSLPLDDYEVYLIQSQKLSIQAENGQVSLLQEATETGAAVRLVQERKVAFACSSDWGKSSLERMADRAFEGLSILGEGPHFSLPDTKAPPAKSSKTVTKEAGKDLKTGMAIALEREARGFDGRVSRVREARYSEETCRVTIKNSSGMEVEYAKTGCEISLMVMAEEKGSQEMAWDEQFDVRFENLHPADLARRAASKAVGQLGARPIPTQKAPAVLDAQVAVALLGVLSSSFLGDQVAKGKSVLKDRLGALVYSKQVTLVDDGTYSGGFATAPVDGEGTRMQRNELVTGGILKNFLYDSVSSIGVPSPAGSTGNSVRPHFKEPPRVGVTNFFLKEGHGSLEALLQEMGKGIWIRDVIGMHTADPVTGDFSVGASGQWVEGGRPKFPVRGITISGNIHRLFENVVRAGEEVLFYQSYGSPPLMINSIDIGGL